MHVTIISRSGLKYINEKIQEFKGFLSYIWNMSKNLDELGLKSIVSEYDLFFIDIWGVVHNGIKLYENAIKALEELSNKEKKFILLTNAPRPNLTVINTLKKMGLNNFWWPECKPSKLPINIIEFLNLFGILKLLKIFNLFTILILSENS